MRHRFILAGVLALAFALPAGASAHHANNGLHCGKGHGHGKSASQHLGKRCGKGHTKHHGAGTTSTTTTTTSQQGAETPSGSAGADNGQSANSPAQQCKSQQASNASGFATQFGTDPNAFGKCVSQTAQSHGSNNGAGKAPGTDNGKGNGGVNNGKGHSHS